MTFKDFNKLSVKQKHEHFDFLNDKITYLLKENTRLQLEKDTALVTAKAEFERSKIC